MKEGTQHMAEYQIKEVYFDEYCHKCKHYEDPEKMSGEDICDFCLSHPFNINSHKPVKFESAE